MTRTFAVTGTMTDRQTLRLDEPLPFPAGQVRVTIETVEALPKPTVPYWLEVMNQIWGEQRRRGGRTLTVVEIEAQIHEERQSWGD